MKDGGSAFPGECYNEVPPEAPMTLMSTTKYRGMSMRQWYKGMAISGLLGDSERVADADQYIKMAAQVADAALKEDEEHN
jgi:hypothetical protein